MLGAIYKWTRKNYTRNTTTSKWKLDESKTETRYFTPEWVEKLTGKEEKAFNRAIGAYCRIEKNPYTLNINYKSICPDKLKKREERFEYINLYSAIKEAGNRERQILEEAQNQREVEITEQSAEHFILKLGKLGTEHVGYFDLITKKWVN